MKMFLALWLILSTLFILGDILVQHEQAKWERPSEYSN